MVATDESTEPTVGRRFMMSVRSLYPWTADEDNVRGLARTYANGLYIMARGLSGGAGDPLEEIALDLERQLNGPGIDLRDIFAIEMRLSRLLPADIKTRRYWEYRARFECVASPAELAAYLASDPPPPPPSAPAVAGAAPPTIGEADNLVLLNHIHRNYLLTVLREQAERDLKHWIQRGLLKGIVGFSLLVAVLLTVGYFEWIPEQAIYFGVGLALLYVVGRLGAATSVTQRLQKAVRETGKDPFFEVTALCTGRRGISIAMMEGGIFAVLLYVIFSAGLGQNLGMSGGVFPQVELGSPADRSPDTGSEAGLRSAQPNTTGVGGAKAGQPGGPAVPVGAIPGPGGVSAPAQPSTGPSSLGNSPASASAINPPVPAIAAPPPARKTLPTKSKPRNIFGWTVEDCDASQGVCIPSFIRQLGKHLGFRDYPDFLKMLLLAFLAGFAERLVPDALDRLVPRSQDPSGKVETAVKAGT